MRSLGPVQQRDAKRSAESVWLWSLDLRAALEANDVEKATRLQEVMVSHLEHVGQVLGRAKRSPVMSVRTIKRRPQVGDVVRTAQGRFYEVEAIHYDGFGPVQFYAVVDVATGRFPNSFRPDEVQTVAVADAKRLRAERSTYLTGAAGVEPPASKYGVGTGLRGGS